MSLSSPQATLWQRDQELGKLVMRIMGLQQALQGGVLRNASSLSGMVHATHPATGVVAAFV